jgi:type IV pilus assembly protein PilV
MRLQHGFSLVEVLVTLLILKLGLLGILAAQTQSLRHLQDAIQRTQAVALASSVFNDIRANRHLSDAIGPHLTLQTELPAAPACNPQMSCTPAQLATAQLNGILSRLQPDSGIRLVKPALCLLQGASLQLSISWQQRLTAPERGVRPCAAAVGRAAFSVQGGGR